MLIAALVAASLAVAPACGSATSVSSSSAPSTTHATNTKVLLTAASATRATGSAYLTMDMTMPSAAGTIQAHATGVFRMGSPALGEMRLKMQVPTGQKVAMEERILGTVIYMRSPVFGQALPHGKRWIKLDLSRMGSAGSALGSVMNSGQSDPTQSLSYLQATADTMQNEGTEDVAGVSTTHYHAEVVFKKAVKLLVQRVPAAQRPALRRVYAQFEAQTGITDYPIDVWIDGKGLVRKVHFSMPMLSSGEMMSMTVTMSRFGAPVRISAPPAGQVADISSLSPAAQE